MKIEVIRVEPLFSFLEKWKAQASIIIRYGETIHAMRRKSLPCLIDPPRSD